MATFVPQWLSLVVTIETIWRAQPKINYLDFFRKRLLTSDLGRDALCGSI